MNQITMIPVEKLKHHPENPRLELGDLTELADSIRQNGVMQNLTVVPERGEQQLMTGDYLVVIGNRRMEAGKQAGLKELPCVIRFDMSHTEQISTMMQENMQRQDLTVYEQAMGFQTMMNLGFTSLEIAERTGISQTTVKRRLKMAELDKTLLKKKCAEQIGMGVFEKIAQIEDVKERNKLLEQAGEDNFNWQFTLSMRKQKTEAVMPEAKRQMKEAKAKKIDQSATWSNEYEQLGHTVFLYEWDGKSDLIPKAGKETKELFYYLNGDRLSLYIKHERAKPQKKTEEEKAEEKRIADAWELYREDTKTAAELRRAFVDGMTVTKATWLRHFMRMIEAAALGELDYRSCSDRMARMYCVEDLHYDDRLRKLMENTYELVNEETIPHFILACYEGNEPEKLGYGTGWQKEMPHHAEKPRLDACYDWLCENGYKMSDAERQLQDGSHPCFGGKGGK